MRRIVVISYTEMGRQLNSRLVRYLTDTGDVSISCHYREEFESTDDLLRQEWGRTSAFIFVGAMGIAVRHIAPLLSDKMHDPAVLVADERGCFVIPVLSGHIGGGVALARKTAGMLGAQAVITTATDVEERFAVDVFAKHNHLLIHDPAAAREISSAVLQGKEIEVRTRMPFEGRTPAGLRLGDDGGEDVCFGYIGGRICRLSLRSYIVGIGCKKGKSGDELSAFLRQICERHGIDVDRIAALASIDVKKEETGIWELSRKLSAPYEVFPAEELEQIEDAVASSEFVRQTVGVDNVCERSALCLAKRWSGGCGGNDSGGKDGDAANPDNAYGLLVEKQAQDGMTMAIAKFHPAAYRW